jgi:hypothetical protein
VKRIATILALLGAGIVGATLGFTFGEWLEDRIWAFKASHGWAA